MNPDHNPWQSAQSQGNPYVRNDQGSNNEPYHQNSQPYHQDAQPQQPSNPWQQQPGHSNNPTQYASSQVFDHFDAPTPNQAVRRSDTTTEALLNSQTDRAEQVEHMQQYEATAPQTQDDRNQADLQKQFPGIDSSLIAAIYNDHKSQGAVDMGSVRETLQELQA